MGGPGSGVKRGRVVKCYTCGKEVYKKRKILKKFPRQFCSRKCYHFGTRDRKYVICPTCGKEFIIFPSQLKRNSGTYCSRKCFRKSAKETSIERIVRESLEGMGIEFEAQAEYYNFIMDFYIPSAKTFIEVDGAYWHKIPKRMEMDLRKDLLAIKDGFVVLRIGEEEVRNGNFINKLDLI